MLAERLLVPNVLDQAHCRRITHKRSLTSVIVAAHIERFKGIRIYLVLCHIGITRTEYLIGLRIDGKRSEFRL